MVALDVARVDTLASRRHKCCMKFVRSLKVCKTPSYDPLARMVEEVPYDPIHEYNLRTINPPKTIHRTERLKNFITIKYN